MAHTYIVRESVTNRLALRGGNGRTEADVQADVRDFLLYGGLDLDPGDLHEVRLETQAGDRRRIDVEVGFCVIEVKRDLRLGNVLADAVEQLSDYVSRRTEELGQRYVGILTDGADWRLYRTSLNGSLHEVDSHTLRPEDDGRELAGWLSAVLATTKHLRPSGEEIDRRFGSGSPAHALDREALADLWTANIANSELQLKRDLWAKLLRTAFGEHFRSDDALFIEHTYLVVIAELIAHRLLGIETASIPPRDLVAGRLFAEHSIRGVVESDFFDWPAEVEGGDRVIRALARRVAAFDWLGPGGVDHDVLKHLYESVISPRQRHDLGEYYTPDWLAEAVVEAVVDKPARQRVLDPACGSGTFLFHAVRRVAEALEVQGVANEDVLAHVTRHVVGVDVHPVAVTLARVTYLLALGDRLDRGRKDLAIPVYLGDSIQWQLNHDTLGPGGLAVVTDDGAGLLATTLHFPTAAMEDPVTFDRLVSELTEKAAGRERGSHKPSITAHLKKYGLRPSDAHDLEATFSLLCDLHDAHRDHIWGYYVRNLARPLWLTRERVDCLVGNPPWLAYRYMTPAMQKTFQTRSKERNLWVGGRVATQQDLSGYFLVRCAELYLRHGGRFGFVMPLATLSRRAAEGLRSGRWSANGWARFAEAWDLDAVRPHVFPVPACVLTGSYATSGAEGAGSRLEGPTEVWSGNSTGLRSWAQAEARLHRKEWHAVANPRSGGTPSPYRDRFMQGATIVPRVLHVVKDAPATGGLGLPTGQRMVSSRRSNLEKEPWKRLPDRGPIPIERQFVRPLYFGETVLPFRCLEPGLAVIPWSDHLMNADDPDLDNYPRLAAWWREGVALWEARKPSMRLHERLDFQRTLTAQLPAAPQRVVYSASGKRLAAARVTDPTAVIEHKLYWAAVSDADEGRYLCAVLNAEATTALVEPMQSRGLFGPRDFDMYVWMLPIPEFDPGNPAHTRLSALGAHAEAQAAGVPLPPEAGFQRARKILRDALSASGLAGKIDAAVRDLLGVGR